MSQEPACAGTAVVYEWLQQSYGEFPAGVGDNNRGGHIILFVSANGRTFTFVLEGDGITCLVISGSGWQQIRRAGVLP